jgi:hypothetical protein
MTTWETREGGADSNINTGSPWTTEDAGIKEISDADKHHNGVKKKKNATKNQRFIKIAYYKSKNESTDIMFFHKERFNKNVKRKKVAYNNTYRERSRTIHIYYGRK